MAADMPGLGPRWGDAARRALAPGSHVLAWFSLCPEASQG